MRDLINWKFFSLPNSLARSFYGVYCVTAGYFFRLLFIIMMLLVVVVVLCGGAKLGLVMK